MASQTIKYAATNAVIIFSTLASVVILNCGIVLKAVFWVPLALPVLAVV